MSPPLGEELWSVLVLLALTEACLFGRRGGRLGRLIAGKDLDEEDGGSMPGRGPNEPSH